MNMFKVNITRQQWSRLHRGLDLLAHPPPPTASPVNISSSTPKITGFTKRTQLPSPTNDNRNAASKRIGVGTDNSHGRSQKFL